MSQTSEQVSLRFAAKVVLDLNGETKADMGERIERAVYDATFGAGVVTGSTNAEVAEHYFDVVFMTPEADRIDEENLAAWLSMQIESGQIKLESIPAVMARYALADPAELLNELASLMFPNGTAAGEAIEPERAGEDGGENHDTEDRNPNRYGS